VSTNTTTDPTPDSTTDEVFVRLPVDRIVPDPENRKAVLDAEFVNSVREHGVLDPVWVKPDPDKDGMYRLIAGERRWRAAVKTEKATIPALVRDISDEEAIEQQIVENLHRRDFRPVEEAMAMFRLIERGKSQKDLARTINRSSKYVGTRLRLLELPAKARKLVDEGEISIDDGIKLLALVDHPEHLDHVIDNNSHNVEWAVKMRQREIEREAEVASLVARCEADGVAVLDDGYSGEYTPLGERLRLDPDDHKAERCHAVLISNSTRPVVVPVCLDKKRHAARGDSKIKAEKAPADEAKAAERAEREARKRANAERWEFMSALLAGRIAKGDALALVLGDYLGQATYDECEAACELLGVEADGDAWDRWLPAFRAYADVSEASALRAAVALACVRAHDRIKRGHAGDDGQRLLAWLAEQGFEPSGEAVDAA